MRAYRRAVLLPGLLPLLVGLVSGARLWTLFGMIHLSLAGGDLAVWLALCALPATHRVLDHPSPVGCTVLAPAPSASPETGS